MNPPHSSSGRRVTLASHHRLSGTGDRVLEEELTEAGKLEITKVYVGPLPSPDDLLEYNQALPGTADRIISMAECEARHRHALEERLAFAQSRNSTLGIVSGFVVGLSGIAGGVYAMVHGADLAGAGGALTALAALAGVFVTQHRAARREPSPATGMA